MSNFETLRKSSGTASGLEKLTRSVEALANGGGNNDEADAADYWKPTIDKSGNAFAVIRFLPTPNEDIENDGLPFIKYFDHGFQGPNGWYIEKSLTSIGKTDKISEMNRELWNSGTEAGKQQARNQKRRLHYVSNIYIIRDAANPEAEGKVFKFIYGKKIFEKLLEAVKPPFEDKEAVNPFDMWTGANFKLKMRKVDDYPNYDLSEWESTSPLASNDKDIENIWKQSFSLLEMLDPKHFKTEKELEDRLRRIMGIDTQKSKFNSDELAFTQEKKVQKTIKPEVIKSSPKVEAVEAVDTKTVDLFNTLEEEDDDDLSYFSKLVED